MKGPSGPKLGLNGFWLFSFFMEILLRVGKLDISKVCNEVLKVVRKISFNENRNLEHKGYQWKKVKTKMKSKALAAGIRDSKIIFQ